MVPAVEHYGLSDRAFRVVCQRKITAVAYVTGRTFEYIGTLMTANTRFAVSGLPAPIIQMLLDELECVLGRLGRASIPCRVGSARCEH